MAELILFTISSLPVFLLGMFIYKKDRNKEPWKLLVKLFVGGILSCFLVLIVSAILGALFPILSADSSTLNLFELIIHVFIGVALVEECCKWIFAYKFSYNDEHFDEIYDMIIYNVFVALGFAFFENLLYVYENGIMTGIIRAISAVLGHGGKDSGAVSNKIIEKDLNLTIAKELYNALGQRGAIVLLIRDGDYDLSSSNYSRKRSDLYNRAKMINESKANMFISIHLNSDVNSSYRGIQLFYNSINKENKLIAEAIYSSLENNINNIRDNKEYNDYYMYKNIKVPGILIECGFISNPYDNYNLRQNSYRERLINLIVDGIINYYN